MSILYNLRRINEICKEHVDNNFLPLPAAYTGEFELIRTEITTLFNDTLDMMGTGTTEAVPMLRRHCDNIKDQLSISYHRLHSQLRDGDPSAMTVLYVYLNLLQETQEMVSALRKYLRAFAKLRDSDFSGRPSGVARRAEPSLQG